MQSVRPSIRSVSAIAGLFGLVTLSLALAINVAGQVESDPARLFNAAQDAHERGQLQDAILLYRKALEVFPKFPEAEFQLGNAYRQKGDLENAEESYRRALDIRRNWTLPMVSLASVRASRGDFKEAEELVQDAIGLGGENSAAYVVLAEVMIRRNAPESELKSVLSTIRELNSRPKQSASLLVSQGAIERRLGEARSASANIANALRLEPSNTAALAESVELALAARDSDTATSQAQKLFRITPDSDAAKFLLARALASSGENDKAIAQLDALRETSPASEELRRDLSVAQAKDPAELERLLLENPNDNLVVSRLCVLLRSSNPSKAVDYCRRVLQTDPSNLTFATRYAAALVQAQKFQEAGALLLQLREAAPENYTVRANLATVYFLTKRWEEAKKEYKWLQERQPGNVITYFMLGIVHDRLQEYLAALGQYQQFLAAADPKVNQLEIEKVNLRLPILRNQIKEKRGR